MLLITCSYGKVGRRIVPYLAKKGLDIKAMDMNPKVKEYEKLGIKTLVGDGSSKKDMKEAMKDVDQVVYIPPQFTFIEAEMGKIAIDAAIDAHVDKFIQLSVMYPNMSTLIQHRQKSEAEEYLVYRGFESDLNWTILRPAGYHHNLFLKQYLETGLFPNYRPLDMPVSYLDALDEADVIEKVLKEDGHKRAIYLLSDEIKTPNEICDIMNDVMGTSIKPIYVDADHLQDYWPDYFAGGDSYAKATFIAMEETYTKWGLSLIHI